MAPGGSCSVQLLPAHYAGAAAREKSHSCSVSQTRLDVLVPARPSFSSPRAGPVERVPSKVIEPQDGKGLITQERSGKLRDVEKLTDCTIFILTCTIFTAVCR